MFGDLASLADFTTSVDSFVDARTIIEDRNLSLYCIHRETNEAVFVELPDGIDLTTEPFVYLAQYRHARRLLCVPCEHLLEVASNLPAIDHLIVIYMSGRCGSTLVSRALSNIPGVQSLSEPDVPTQFVHLRCNKVAEEDLRALLDACLRFLFRPRATQLPGTCAIKLRSQGSRLVDLFQATFPRARNLFLYRDAIGWTGSMYRIFKRLQFAEYDSVSDSLERFTRSFNTDCQGLRRFLGPNITVISLPEQLALWWLSIIEWHMAGCAMGIPSLAIRYQDLSEKPEAVMRRLLEHCAISDSHLASALAVFDSDSQEGTLMARSRKEGATAALSDAQIAQVCSIIGRHPVIKVPDFVVPDTELFG